MRRSVCQRQTSPLRRPQIFDESPRFARKVVGTPVIRAVCIRTSLLGLLLVGLACSPSRDLPLLTVSDVTPDRIAEGRIVTLSGQGFPAGRRGNLELVGEAYAPGQRPRSVRLVRPAF